MKAQLLKQIIFNSQKAEEEIEFDEPLTLKKSEMIEVFGKPRSFLTSRGDMWVETLVYGNIRIIVIYDTQFERIYRIYRIKILREGATNE